jgi:hypothetical protein
MAPPHLRKIAFPRRVKERIGAAAVFPEQNNTAQAPPPRPLHRITFRKRAPPSPSVGAAEPDRQDSLAGAAPPFPSVGAAEPDRQDSLAGAAPPFPSVDAAEPDRSMLGSVWQLCFPVGEQTSALHRDIGGQLQVEITASRCTHASRQPDSMPSPYSGESVVDGVQVDDGEASAHAATGGKGRRNFQRRERRRKARARHRGEAEHEGAADPGEEQERV